MNIKDLLSVESYVFLGDLKSGKLSERNFHSKKWYAKETKNIKKLVDLASAWEVYKIEK